MIISKTKIKLLFNSGAKTKYCLTYKENFYYWGGTEKSKHYFSIYSYSHPKQTDFYEIRFCDGSKSFNFEYFGLDISKERKKNYFWKYVDSKYFAWYKEQKGNFAGKIVGECQHNE